MSAAHHSHSHKFTDKELNEVLDDCLSHPKIKARLARPYKLVTSFDIALLGSSSIGGARVYLDRHLRHDGGPFGVILVERKPLDVKPGLIRHERLEQALEDELGFTYEHAHVIAQHWEERDYRRKGFSPGDVERAFKPYIKQDEHERIQKSPTDLDLRPVIAPPKSTALLKRINETAQREKRSHASVDYVSK
jgi:hypothetical protein